jgi:hypothetical protein
MTDANSGVITIPLKHGDLLLDEADAWVLDIAKWHSRPAGRTAYAWGLLRRGTHPIAPRDVAMHRLLLDFPTLLTDHANGNGLDNRRSNLRIATARQNAQNARSVGTWMRGVDRLPSGRYRARIRVEGRQVTLGIFDTEAEAGAAYVQAAREHHGEYAPEGRWR